MQHELELRAKINAILTEGEEPQQLNESLALGLLGAVVAFVSLVITSVSALERGPGAPLFQAGHGGNTTTPAKQHPLWRDRKSEKIYRKELIDILNDAYKNAIDLSRRYPQAAKFFDEVAARLKRIIVNDDLYTARELEDVKQYVYNWMFDIKRWAKKKREELEHMGRS